MLCLVSALPTFPLLQHLRHAGKLLKLTSDPCCHRRGAAQLLVNADEVVVHEVDRDRVRVVLCPFEKALVRRVDLTPPPRLLGLVERLVAHLVRHRVQLDRFLIGRI